MTTTDMNRFSVLTGIPEMTKGLVREIRVRWTLEEMGLPYEEVRYPHPETKKEDYLKKQPFGQVPYFSSGDLQMFESGAIVLHLALKHNMLLPLEESARAEVLTWLFAAQSSLEPFIFHSFMLKNDPEASDSAKAKAVTMIEQRLDVIQNHLSGRKYLGEEFSIADIVMTCALMNCERAGLLSNFSVISQYLQSNESRPAYQRAYNDHIKLYESK